MKLSLITAALALLAGCSGADDPPAACTPPARADYAVTLETDSGPTCEATIGTGRFVAGLLDDVGATSTLEDAGCSSRATMGPNQAMAVDFDADWSRGSGSLQIGACVYRIELTRKP